MGKRLTDKEKKKIISDYVENNNYRETARINKMPLSTVIKIVKQDDTVKQKCSQKQEENTKSTLEYMSEQHETKKQLVKNILEAMNKKSLNVDMFTNIKDLATAYGIIIDKELKVVELDLKRQELKIKNKEIEAVKRIVIVDDLPCDEDG